MVPADTSGTGQEALDASHETTRPQRSGGSRTRQRWSRSIGQPSTDVPFSGMYRSGRY